MELQRFRDGTLNRELNDYFNRRYPGYNPAGDPFDRFATQKEGQWQIDLGAMLRWIHHNPHVMPTTAAWNSVFAFMAREIMSVATRNNVGYVDETDTYFMQYGVNFFTHHCNLLLIGGTIYHKCLEDLAYHGEDLKLIASGALYREEESSILRPAGKVFLDAHYFVSILGGLYGRLDPERALKVMKRYLQPLE